MQQSVVSGARRLVQPHPHRASRTQRVPRGSAAVVRCEAAANGTSASCPSAPETARTVMHLASEGTLSTLLPGGAPLGMAVAYHLDADGHPIMQLRPGSLEASNLRADPRCSLLVQPATWPARRVGAVALTGSASPAEEEDAAQAGGLASYKLQVDSCHFTSGLDAAAETATFSGAEYASAEADVLRHAAHDLINTWNSDRAEDVYRIVSHHLSLPLTEMAYAELMWLDRLGLYIRAEVVGREPAVVRVPFYRPVLDERDARSVITMAAQISWEADRAYTPPIPAVFLTQDPAASAAAAAAAN